MTYMEENKKISLDNKKIWVAGHNGMVGKSIVRLLKKRKCEIIFSERKKVDLTNQLQVENWMNVFNQSFGNTKLSRVYIPSFDCSWNFSSSINH